MTEQTILENQREIEPDSLSGAMVAWRFSKRKEAYGQFEFLFVIEDRTDRGEGIVLNTPVGSVDQDEHPIHTACREFFEETGMIAGQVMLIGDFTETFSNGHTTQRFCFATEVTPKMGEFVLTGVDQEIVGHEWLTYSEILERTGLSPDVSEYIKLRNDLALKSIQTFVKVFETRITET